MNAQIKYLIAVVLTITLVEVCPVTAEERGLGPQLGRPRVCRNADDLHRVPAEMSHDSQRALSD